MIREKQNAQAWSCSQILLLYIFARYVNYYHIMTFSLISLVLFRYGISPENIILYGQSIGTVPTVDLASRYECAAVVLHSPLTSGMRVAFPDTKKTYCFDAFPK